MISRYGEMKNPIEADGTLTLCTSQWYYFHVIVHKVHGFLTGFIMTSYQGGTLSVWED